MNRLQGAIFIIVFMMLFTACGHEKGFVSDGFETESEETFTSETETAEEGLSSEEVSSICVDVEGEVKSPGVYTLAIGSRVSDAIKAAGGFSKDAYAPAINQARELSDGEQIVVRSEDEAAEVFQGSDDSLVNLNTATKEELMTLPGIGESKATDIISYREAKGGFSAIEDIMKVPGIKTGLFEKIKDKVKL